MRFLAPILLLIFCILHITAGAQPLPALIPYVDNNKWGYCDSNGVVKIKPRWDDVTFFSNGKAIVTNIKLKHKEWNFTYCLIDDQGHYIIPPSRHWNGKWSGWNTGMNARGKNGKWGIIDTNNKEVLPCGFDLSRCEFRYNSVWNKYYAIVEKNGKYGFIDTFGNTLLPFVYDFVDDSKRYDNDIPPYYFEVAKSALRGIIDTNGKVIVPCRYNHIRFDRQGFSKGMLLNVEDWGGTTHNSYADISGKMILALPDFSIWDFPVDTFVPVLKKGGRYGIMSLAGNLLLPCIYSGAWVRNDTIIVTRDSNYVDSFNNSNSYHYRRYYSTHSLQPISDWFLPVYISTPVVPPRSECDKYIPLIKINGRDTCHFVKDGIIWSTTDFVKWPQKYFAVKGMSVADSLSYLALVDTELNYIVSPMKMRGVIIDYNVRDGLMAVRKDSARYTYTYGVFNKDHEQLIPFQSSGIVSVFYWEHKPYAVTNTGGRGNVNNLIGSDGLPVKQLANYTLTGMVNKYGYANDWYRFEGDKMEGYFSVNIHYGGSFIDMGGHLMYPKVKIFAALDDGFFLSGWPHAGTLVDTANTSLFPGVVVSSASKVRWNINNDWHCILSGKFTLSPSPPPPLYTISYKYKADEESSFYMNKRGKGYFGRLKKMYVPAPPPAGYLESY